MAVIEAASISAMENLATNIDASERENNLSDHDQVNDNDENVKPAVDSHNSSATSSTSATTASVPSGSGTVAVAADQQADEGSVKVVTNSSDVHKYSRHNRNRFQRGRNQNYHGQGNYQRHGYRGNQQGGRNYHNNNGRHNNSDGVGYRHNSNSVRNNNYGLWKPPYRSNFEPSEEARAKAEQFFQAIAKNKNNKTV